MGCGARRLVRDRDPRALPPLRPVARLRPAADAPAAAELRPRGPSPVRLPPPPDAARGDSGDPRPPDARRRAEAGALAGSPGHPLHVPAPSGVVPRLRPRSRPRRDRPRRVRLPRRARGDRRRPHQHDDRLRQGATRSLPELGRGVPTAHRSRRECRCARVRQRRGRLGHPSGARPAGVRRVRARRRLRAARLRERRRHQGGADLHPRARAGAHRRRGVRALRGRIDRIRARRARALVRSDRGGDARPPRDPAR
ncbi:hypothetical protein EDF54_3289 [Rathayibacter sp. PhB93]|nr:hypothetical protein EDF54_3289 [Rathayibacter sp. PhB93]TDQ10835.1 hypothetical protein EDF17_3077 [Rathayibacter sp. PhB1]